MTCPTDQRPPSSRAYLLIITEGKREILVTNSYENNYQRTENKTCELILYQETFYTCTLPYMCMEGDYPLQHRCYFKKAKSYDRKRPNVVKTEEDKEGQSKVFCFHVDSFVRNKNEINSFHRLEHVK